MKCATRRRQWPTVDAQLMALGLTLLVPTVWADDADSDEPPPPVRLEVKELDWAQVIDAVLPGRALDVAPWPGDGAELQGLAVLVQPEAEGLGPQLYRLQGRQDDLQPVVGDLPEDIDSLHLQGDRLWLGADDAVYRLDNGTAELLLRLGGLRLDDLVERGLITEERILIPEVGRLRTYSVDLQATEESVELPVEAQRRARRIQLQSPPMRRLGTDDRYWVGDPQTVDAHRLRVTWIDQQAAADERLQESWLRFATPEDLEQFRFVHIDGRPAVLLATTRGDKLGIFEKLRLRTFLLKSDRTRAGRLPRAQVETATRNWYAIDPSIVDFDGNGKDDLLLIQPQGLGAGELLVELHLGRGGGLLEPRSRRSKLKLEAAGWDMSSDVTGDGTPDLLVVSGGEFSIYAGLPQHKRRVVDDKPLHHLAASVLSSATVSVSIDMSNEGSSGESIGLHSRPRLLQLDADATPEIVVLDNLRGRGVLRVVDLK